ncbi:hypothetical protein [Pontiella sulfatireligans]|uniref:hypothetical protein n=1 Tax=Pontiella sulfatireligans TaxID=2750658 RepID=UPI001443C417|nr:hypothetical protein [Pontiella sulfatireligans]
MRWQPTGDTAFASEPASSIGKRCGASSFAKAAADKVHPSALQIFLRSNNNPTVG